MTRPSSAYPLNNRSSLFVDGLSPLNSVIANNTIEFSAPSATNVSTGPNIINGYVNFELKPAFITMVQASPFYGKSHEDANAHLQHVYHQRSHSRGHLALSLLVLTDQQGSPQLILLMVFGSLLVKFSSDACANMEIN